MKILVISMAGIGDTLLATPLIHELRAGFPAAQIDALVLWSGSRDLLEGNPHINRVWQKNLLKDRSLASLKFLLDLRREGYDVSINTHPQSRTHYRLIARLVAARRRLSHVYECSGLLDRWMVSGTLEQDYKRHTIEQNLDFLELMGVSPSISRHEMEVYLTPAEHVWAGSFLSDPALAGCKLLGVHMGSGGTKNLRLKRWPLEQYLALFQKLQISRPDLRILLFGGPEESAEIQSVLAQTKPGFAMRAATQNLRQAAALLRCCDAFLSVDTALMHLAAAVKVRQQIVIEAPTLNATNAPRGTPPIVVPNPAVAGRNLDFYRYDGRGIRGTQDALVRCMTSVTVPAVHAAVVDALARS